MNPSKRALLLSAGVAAVLLFMSSWNKRPTFKALVVLSKAKDHVRWKEASVPFLEKMATENNFEVTITDDTSLINKENLARYKVFVQFHLASFDMSYSQQAALQDFIEAGNGWVGIHGGGLTGSIFKSEKRKYWQWFEDFIGAGYSPHPAFQNGTLVVEDKSHPVMKGLPGKFEVKDEWYEFDRNPRPNVRVLATADESTYQQKKPMGDHPMIWSNGKYRRMIYIAIGHDPALCGDANFQMLVRNAILWAGEKK